MQQTKLIQLLRCFSTREIKQFDNFLQASYFNKNKMLLRFYRLLSAHHPQLESIKLEKETVYTNLYGPGNYRDKTMRDITSQLYQLANEFIAHNHLKNAPLDLDRQKYLWLTERGSEKLRGQAVEYSERLLEKHPIKDGHFYLHKWLAEFNRFEYQADLVKDREHKFGSVVGLDAHLDSLNRYYLIKGLETQLYILSVSIIYKLNFDQSSFQLLEILAQRYVEKGDVVLDIYYNLIQLEKTQDGRYYKILKAKFFSNDPAIPTGLMKEIAISLESHLSRETLKEKDDNSYYELMEVFKFMIEHELMYSNGEIGYYFFQNVTLAALRTEPMAWVESFIDTYKVKLPEKYRDEVYNYCKAFFLFRVKNFDDALQLALSVNTIMYFNKIDIKGLIARIYFELERYEQLEIMLDSYKYHLAEGMIPPLRKERYTNFVKTIRMLSELKQNYSPKLLLKLSSHFKMHKRIQSRDWFEEKIRALER